MDIHRLPALSDNYIFLLCSRHTAAVVDPAVAEPVLAKLKELGVTLEAIFNTHHHGDHVGGNAQLLRYFPDCVVYGGATDQGRIPGQKIMLRGGDRVTFAGQTAMVYFVPGHTSGHIAYYFPSPEVNSPGHLFCGDTLFAGGCGRLFEGTPEQMVDSLHQFRQLPDNTLVWCAHEYTLKNLQFALTVDPDNLELQKRSSRVRAMRQQNQPTIPALLGEEKLTNPFLRCDRPELQNRLQTQGTVHTFRKLRGMKDQF